MVIKTVLLESSAPCCKFRTIRKMFQRNWITSETNQTLVKQEYLCDCSCHELGA